MAHRSSIGFLFLLTLSAVVAMLGTPASAAVSVFTWGNVASDWGAAANWSPAGPPTGVSAVALFTSASYSFQPTLASASQSLGGIWDNGAGAVTISANSNFALTLAGTTINGHADTGLELDSGAGSLTIDCPVTMSAVQVWNNYSANPLTINSTVNWGGANNAMLNTSGSGALVLAGSLGNIGTGNNYLGGVTITGTCTPGNTQFVGFDSTTVSETTTIAPGGLMNLVSGNGHLAIANYLVVNGGTIQNVSAPAGDIVGIGWNAGQAGVLTINSGLVNFTGLNNVNFGHAASAQTQAALNLNGGTYIMSFEPTGTGAMNFNGGTLQLNGNVTTFAPTSPGQGIVLNVGNGGAIFNLNGHSTNITGVLNGVGSGGLTVYNTSAGTLTLSANNTYTGPTQINGGLVALSGAGNLGNGGALTLNGGGVDLGGSSPTVGAVSITAAAANGNTIQNGTLTAPSYTVSNSSGNAIVAAGLTGGAGGLTMSGTGGQVTLAASSPLTGATNVTGGTLVLNAAGANTGALPNTSAVTIGSAAGLAAQGAASIGTGLTLAAGANLNLSDGSATTNFTVNGNLALGAGNQGTTVGVELGNGLADLMNVTGAASLAGTSTVNIFVANGTSIVPGSYDLITAASGLAVGNFTLGSKPAGFNTYTLSTATAGALVVTVTGNPTPATAYWSGKASAALSDSANKWSNGSSISTSNWSTTPNGLTDPQQVPGPITDVYFTAANATGNAGGSLTTTLDQAYIINSLTFAVTPGTIGSVAISTSANKLTIGSGGLTLANTSGAAGSINGSGGVIVNGSQNWANNSNSQMLTVTAPISALSGATTLTVNGTGTGAVVLGGQTSDGLTGGTLSLALNNAGTVTLGGSSANTYSGGTTISSGLIQLAGTNALGSGPLTVSAGTLNLAGYSQTAGTFSGPGGTIWNNSGAGLATLSIGAGGGTFSGTIADNDGVHTGGSVAVNVNNGGGELTLTGPNTYSGGTTVSGGTLNIIGNTSIGSGRLTMAGGNLDNNSGGPVVLGNIPQTWNSSFTYFGGSLLNLGTGPVTVTVAPTITVQNSSGTLEIDGTISGSGSASNMTFNTAGAGTLLLTGSVGNMGTGNNYFGNMTLTGTAAAPNLLFLGDAASPSSSAATTIPSGGLLNLLSGNTNVGLASYVVVNGGTIQNVSAGTADTFGIGWVSGEAGTLTINSGLVNLAGVTVNFGHAAMGTLNLNGGTYVISTEPTVSSGGGVMNFNGGTLQLNGSIPTFAPAQMTLNVGDGGAVINLNGNSTTISNVLNASGSGGLTVYGTSSGTLTLAGNNNYTGPTQINGGVVDITVAQAYTGNTFVSGGAMVLDATGTNSGSLGSTNVSVSGGATLTARGNTSIGTGNLSVAGGGTLDLRNNAATTYFTVNGNLSLGSGTQGSSLYIELGNSANDVLNVTGSAALSGTSTINLSAIAGSTPSLGQYDLINASSGLSAQDFTVSAGPSLKGFDSYSLSATTPTEVILTVTGNPTPSTAYWTGKASAALSDSTNQWGIGAGIHTSNWSSTPDGLTDPLQVPGSITDVYFTAANGTGVAGSLTTTLDNNYSIAGLFLAVSSGSITGVTINTGSYALALGGDGLTLAASNANATISGSGSILLNASQNWANNSNSQPLTVTVPISAASGQDLTLSLVGTGTGGMVLSGPISNGQGTLSLSLSQSGTTLLGGSVANSYSGGTTISGSTVQLGGNGALGNAGPLTINGAMLNLNGFSATAGQFSGGATTILNNSGSGVSILTIGQGSNSPSNFSGTIADNDGVHPGGSVALNIAGGGEVTLTGTNTYSGGTTVGGASTLDIVSSSTIGTGRLTMAGGNLDNSSGGPVILGNIPQTWNSGFQYFGGSLLNLGTGPVTVSSTSSVTLTMQNSSGTLEIDGNLTSGTAALSTQGPGLLVLTGSDSITTPTTTNVATFFSSVLTTGTLILNGGNFALKPSGTFTVAGGFTSATAALNGVGTVVGNAGGTTYMVVSGGTYQQANDLLYLGQGGNGNGVLTIEGSGVVALGTAPLGFSYNGSGGQTGTLQLNGGTLQTSGFSTPTSVAGQTVNFNGGVLELTANTASLFGQPADFTANVENGMTVNVNGYSSTVNVALLGSGSGGLTVTSANGGKLTLSAENTYMGGTYVEGDATLILANSEAILEGTSLYVGSANDASLFGGVVPEDAGSRPDSAIAAAAAAVPEPCSLALAAALLGSAAVYRRVRRK